MDHRELRTRALSLETEVKSMSLLDQPVLSAEQEEKYNLITDGIKEQMRDVLLQVYAAVTPQLRARIDAVWDAQDRLAQIQTYVPEGAQKKRLAERFQDSTDRRDKATFYALVKSPKLDDSPTVE